MSVEGSVPQHGISPHLNASEDIRVAVYGTLKRGRSNHRLLRGACFLGEDCLPGLRLYDLGSYPGAVTGRSVGIAVEVFSIRDTHLPKLDWLEDCRPDLPAAGLYRRLQVETRFGTAWLYLYNGTVKGRRWIRSGRW